MTSVDDKDIAEIYIKLQAKLVCDEIVMKTLESKIKTGGIEFATIVDEVVNIYIETLKELEFTEKEAIEELEMMLHNKKRSVVNE